MPLEEYRRKRHFKRTPEPGAKVAQSKGEPIFVIQEHHATRLHYDFRLEADGVLKSWAVTKEPTLDPSIKRLAVEVEDHPLGYATFSGDIPEGEYGAGHVDIWDHGTYRNIMLDKPEPMTIAEGIEAGHLEFELHGEKLHGKFAMILMKDRGPKHNWLLIKMKDEFAEADGTSGGTADDAGSKAASNRKRKAASAKSATRNARPVAERTGSPEHPKLTNLDKVMFPGPGYTKGDLLDYYERVAGLLIPHLKDRPVTIERFPDGLGEDSPRFWQKNTPDYYPEWIARVDLPGEDGKHTLYTVVNDVDTLLYLVNLGTITLHVWQSRIDTLDHPDYVVFDLDPGERSFEDVVTVAKTLHAVLREEEIDTFIKTSGKSGLHIIVPWTASGDYDEAREWMIEVAQRVIAEIPEIATMERMKNKRGGRLYFDVMQNVRGRHVVPPYVVRGVPEATVSVPLNWREVTASLSPKKFDIGSMLRRTARQKHDPFEELVKILKLEA